MVPWAPHRLRTYWRFLIIVTKAGGYYGPPFRDYCGLIQGYPLSLTIFNAAVEAIIQHWLIVVASTEVGAKILGMPVQYLVAYFYTDDGLLVFTYPDRLKIFFDVLIELFNRVGLQKNVQTKVIMAYHPCHTPGGML